MTILPRVARTILRRRRGQFDGARGRPLGQTPPRWMGTAAMMVRQETGGWDARRIV
ncbi:MAG TPA: hypothetical protein VEZ44_01555 [bacterium]|nr:hypothetical protein [bacterium]